MPVEIPFSSVELERLQRHYASLKDKPSYDAFIRSAHALLQRIGADPYHVRMALTNGHSMMEFGSRAAYRHKEDAHGIGVGLLVMEADLPLVPEELRQDVDRFKPSGETAYVKFTVPTWADIPQGLLAMNEKAMRWEYERIKDTKLVEIRRGSSTDNEALRYAVVNGITVPELPGPLGLVMVNITWNSNDWKRPSDDPSDHRYVKAGNTPYESWNFDFDNPRNTPEKIYGYSQRTAEPKVTGSNNLVIFYSQGKIVGFYGGAEFLHEKIHVNDQQDCNIVGDRSLSLVLPRKLDDIKAKGYLEDKQRMGQNGFIYLEDPGTALRMIDEAIDLNPSEAETLQRLRNWLTDRAPSSRSAATSNESEQMKIPLNRIFYGPPGTGKTFHTVGAAVAVCDPAFYAEHKDDPAQLRERFNELLVKDMKKADGQIAFCTFHQSYSYEDFVEGIKPVEVEEDSVQPLRYHTRPGILKEMARRAGIRASGEAAKMKHKLGFTPEQFDQAQFFKLSLGDTQNPEDQLIYDYCIENKCIAIGFMHQHDLTGLSEHQVRSLPLQEGQSSYHTVAMNYFSQYVKEGDIVVVTKGNYLVRAIGRVTGPYRYDPRSPIGYPHFRDVEWLLANEDIPYEELYGRQFSQQSIYKLKKEDIKRDFFVRSSAADPAPDEARNFVLIIDEINRGNVAGIFGELITLIEENKRKGRPEALEVTLPYSQEPFSIPDNLYIIGTMNTADRSVEALDAALRRRFSFTAMMPEPGLLQPLQGSAIDLAAMLGRINARLVQLLDEDHQIGHSHFWDLHKEADPLPALRQVFTDKVIPQLEEYFHRDRAKLQLVLGERFVSGSDPADDLFLGDANAMAPDPRTVYTITPMDTWDEAAFRSLYEKV
ncbi:MAG: AAA family ATPase [Flavobacteriales bacterium]|nr:hypothetical protein [Flavobacteriales bacterium]MCC6577052.1 AAA family ATPase [Flavobacteriales bacterium]NUQ15906.1 AAA family ATPase [Flavobacteriales bacterium]